MSDPAGEAREERTPATAPTGLSAFIAKVLDQLSLSAWLPAAFFASCLTLLLQLRRQQGLNVTTALNTIADEWVTVLLLGVPVLVLTVLVVQASSFSAIQFLEGYGAARGPGRWVRSLMIRCQVWRRNALRKRRFKEQATAFDRSEHRWDEPAEVMYAMWADARGRPRPELTDDHEERLADLDWRSECDPWSLARIEEMADKESEYPAPARVLPSRLGNILRSAEDDLENTDGDLATFVLRRRPLVSPRTQIQHDQFRTRLDMYCTLVLIGVTLIPISAWALLGLERWWVVPVLFALFAYICYRAAIASARGYVVTLRVMDQAVAPKE